MNWKFLAPLPWLDTRAHFVSGCPRGGALLDIGSSDGETLCHIHELRPDLRLFATDLFGSPENYPSNTTFHRGDIQAEPLPWADGSIDAVTCMHLVEHLSDHSLLVQEIARVLKPGGRVYFETPHPKTTRLPSAGGAFTLNFFDDPTHIEIVTMESLGERAGTAGLVPVKTGVSRNLLFAAAYPLLYFTKPGRKRYTARIHFIGWSAYLIANKPSGESGPSPPRTQVAHPEEAT